jgi:arginyl-tRNA synthetase
MSLSNLLEAAGYEVVRTNLVNDRGIHICQSMLAYMKWGNGATPASTGEKGDHFVGRFYILFSQVLKEERAAFFAIEGIDSSKADREAREEAEERFLASSQWMREAKEMLRSWEEGDPDTLDLWRRMNGWVMDGFRQTYDRLGCRFDRIYLESETWTLGKSEVDRGLAAGTFYRKEDGSVWARLEPVGLQDKVVLRSDGTSVYITDIERRFTEGLRFIGRFTSSRRNKDHQESSRYCVRSEFADDAICRWVVTFRAEWESPSRRDLSIASPRPSARGGAARIGGLLWRRSRR